ncbi:DNA-directed RNA polymerase subunit K [Nitrososphaera sp.]|uniref:DNA-directed RNA polymerase subunit K n=1 Tax=Nitrososphaera sp. TaxID=1971748 RepID=UPI001823F39C|nr:DNA-directed RNA polymerase subunit K [Nitrososphaera sp.]NWG37115.1 DNA-directed RNA polymerase subunit K [Nitrososphaera sp.]
MVVKRFTKKTASKKSAKTKGKVEEEEVKKSSRPADEVVTYAESEYELREVEAQGNKIVIGLPWLTRFERARITGARALQLSLGAPPLIKGSEEAKTSILLAMEEVEQKALPISIRRVLPNGLYQDIPIDWMK